MVVRQVTFFINRCQLELVRCYLVMAGLYRNPQFITFGFQILHKLLDARRDGPEIMVVQLLVLGTLMPQQRPFGQRQIRTRRIQIFVYQKILLLPSQIGNDLIDIFIEIMTNLFGRLVQSLDRTYQRGFIIQRFACIGNENGRNTKRIIHNESRRRRIPGRITACFERVAQPSIRKTGCVRLLLGKQFTAKLFNHASIPVMFDKGIMFFCRAVGQRLKPMGIVGSPFLQGPHAHTGCYEISYLPVNRNSVINGISQSLVGFL